MPGRIWNAVLLGFVLGFFTGCEEDSPETPYYDDWGPPRKVYPLIDVEPAWSPDGRTIAYYHYGIVELDPDVCHIDPDSAGIWFVDPDGSNPRLFINGGRLPDWSPDSGRLVLVGGGSQIYTIDVDGNNLERLTNEGTNLFPAWSPCGTKIAYNSDIEPGGIWIIDPDGRGRYCLGEGGCWLDWSHDGRYILYELRELYRIDHVSRIITQLTFFDDRDFLRHPAYSPCGKRIAFTYSLYTGDFPNYPQIYVMDADGSNLMQLTTRGGWQPSWSPGGNRIVYVCCRGYECEPEHGTLWVMNADGSEQHQITVSPIKLVYD